MGYLEHLIMTYYYIPFTGAAAVIRVTRYNGDIWTPLKLNCALTTVRGGQEQETFALETARTIP